MLLTAVVDSLIALGRAGRPGAPAILASPDGAWELLMVGNEPWRAAAQPLAEYDLGALIRGLVLFSHETGWSGGSVSPVITLYREYLERQPSDEPSLTEWIVDHRRNEYEPFGTMLHGDARTVAQFREYQAVRRGQAAQRRERDAERQRQDAQVKADVATSRIAAAVRRGDIFALQGLVSAGGSIRGAGGIAALIDVARTNNRPKMVAFLESFDELAGGSGPNAPSS